MKPLFLLSCLSLVACGGNVSLGTVATEGDAGTDLVVTNDVPQEIPVDAVGIRRSCGNFVDVTTQEGTPITFSADVSREPEFHFLAVYEANAVHDGRAGTVTVRVDRPGRHVLVFYAYEPVDWTIELAADATLDRVEVYGYETQRVFGLPSPAPAGVQSVGFERRDPPIDADCAYTAGCNTQGYATSLSTAFGLPVTSFAGAYRASRFTLRRDPESCRTRGVPLSCNVLLGGSDVYLAQLLLPENEVTLGSRLPLRAPINSMGKRGGDLFVCDRSFDVGRVVRVDASNGAIEASAAPCEAVTANDDGIWVQSSQAGALSRFADWPAVLAGKAAASTSLRASVSRLAVRGPALFGAWHSTNVVERLGLDGSALGQIPLAGYDDWVNGLTVVPDGRLVIAAPDRAGSILTFDVATGKRYESFARPSATMDPFGEYQAIVCESR